MLKTYYMLTKPGIIAGNVVTMAAGFALASQGQMNYGLFLITLMGLGLVIASAGVFNNYIDRVMDAKMNRTKDRALVTGVVGPQDALVYASLLGSVGVAILGFYVNLLTMCIALFGFFVYLVLYAYWKYRSFYGTLVGSVAGAIPPVVGYCAVSQQLDLAALLLFAILILWQMPHFFAIAIYRLEDYAAASIPVLPIQRGMHITKLHMAGYIIAFLLTTLLLPFLGYAGHLYGSIALLLGLGWLILCLNGFKVEIDHARWARKMFIVSLVVIIGLCITMTVDPAL